MKINQRITKYSFKTVKQALIDLEETNRKDDPEYNEFLDELIDDLKKCKNFTEITDVYDTIGLRTDEYYGVILSLFVKDFEKYS